MYKRRRIKRISIAILLVLCFAFFLSQPALAEGDYQPYSETSSKSGGFSEEELKLLQSFASHFMSREELDRYMHRVLLGDSSDMPVGDSSNMSEDIFDLNFDATLNAYDIELMQIYLELLRNMVDSDMDGYINAKDLKRYDFNGDGMINESDDDYLKVLYRLDFNQDGMIDGGDIDFIDFNKDGRADYHDLYLMHEELESREVWNGDFLTPFTDDDGRIQRQISIYGVEWLYDYAFDKDGNVESITVSATLDDRKYEIIINKYSITIRRYHVSVRREEPDPPPDDPGEDPPPDDSGPTTDGINTCSVNSDPGSPQDNDGDNDEDKDGHQTDDYNKDNDKDKDGHQTDDLYLMHRYFDLNDADFEWFDINSDDVVTKDDYDEIKMKFKKPLDLERIAEKGIGPIDLPAIWRALEKLRKERERITQNFQEATEPYVSYVKRELESLNNKYPELFKDFSNKKITTGDSLAFPIADVKLQAQDISALMPDLTVNLTTEQFTNELLLYNIYERKVLEEKVIYLLDAYSNDELALEAIKEFMDMVEMLKKSMLPIYEDFKSKMEEEILEFLNQIDVITKDFVGGEVINKNGQTEGMIKLPDKHKQEASGENNE